MYATASQKHLQNAGRRILKTPVRIHVRSAERYSEESENEETDNEEEYENNNKTRSVEFN